MTNFSDNNPSTKGKTLWRGICGRCPKCHEGKLFKSYLKQEDTCHHCSEDFTSIRPEDAPAWLSIFLTGHIIAPMIGYFALHDVLPLWAATLVLIGITLVTSLTLLPLSKGFFIAALWLTSQKKTDMVQ